MTFWPRSIFGRLLGIAILTTVVALTFATFTIGSVLERFVIRGLDQQLDAEVAMLARAVRPDGTLDQMRIVNLPAFEAGDQGWGWRVESRRGSWTGGDGTDAPAPLAAPIPPDGLEYRLHERNRPRPGDDMGPQGEPVHFRQINVETGAGPVTITAAGPRRVAIAPLREAMVPLLGSLVLLGVALAIATAVQLRVGLRPLRQLRASLADVRAGRSLHISSDQPAELAPLAAELNALIDQNEAQLAHARRHVSNLAHGLKTPLAVLGVKLAEGERDPDDTLGEIVAQIDGCVRHHLGRARAMVPGETGRAHAPVAQSIIDLVSALERIYADRSVRPVIDVASNLAMMVDPHDLAEMVGNLLDNAWRHARSEVRIGARVVDGKVELAIGDDGPGLSDAEIGEALKPGRRLDERGDGHGFGLSITTELAELYGGRLTLGRSSAGGLAATLQLPLAG